MIYNLISFTIAIADDMGAAGGGDSDDNPDCGARQD